MRVSPLLQRHQNEGVGPILAVEVTAGREDGFELRRQGRRAGDDVANPARLGEVSHELAPSGPLGIVLTILGVDRDPRPEAPHL